MMSAYRAILAVQRLPRRTPLYRLAWAHLRGVFGRLERAQIRRAAHHNPAAITALLQGTVILDVIRMQPEAKTRRERYRQLIELMIKPGGRWR